MAAEVIWTPEAEKTFDAVVTYLQKHWGVGPAERFIRKVNTVVSFILTGFPGKTSTCCIFGIHGKTPRTSYKTK